MLCKSVGGLSRTLKSMLTCTCLFLFFDCRWTMIRCKFRPSQTPGSTTVRQYFEHFEQIYSIPLADDLQRRRL
jgi:hypothetical protein